MKDFERIDHLIKDSESLEKAIKDEMLRLSEVSKKIESNTTKQIILLISSTLGRILIQHTGINSKKELDDRVSKTFDITTNQEGCD